LVFTPRHLAKEIIDHYNPQGVVLDPCKGQGAFYNQFPYNCTKYWCEIDKGRDFFDFETKVDWIITNPPWSKIRDFLSHALQLARNIVFLININHIVTKARLRLLAANNFKIKEIYCVPHPRNEDWPVSGFQLAAIHLQQNYRGGCEITGRVAQ
jgi:hypothetical protein